MEKKYDTTPVPTWTRDGRATLQEMKECDCGLPLHCGLGPFYHTDEFAMGTRGHDLNCTARGELHPLSAMIGVPIYGDIVIIGVGMEYAQRWVNEICGKPSLTRSELAANCVGWFRWLSFAYPVLQMWRGGSVLTGAIFVQRDHKRDTYMCGKIGTDGKVS